MKIRKLKFALGEPNITNWIEGNPFKTQLFNAISMSFPFGEGYFIKSFKQIINDDLIRNQEIREKVSIFIAQEALHSSIHGEFNTYLESKGLPFTLLPLFEFRRRVFDSIYSHKTQLAVTMAYEHVTAALSYANLKYGWVNDVEDDNIRRMWNWHSAEEIEHRSVAYELYQEVNGGYIRRIYGMIFTVVCFNFDYGLQTIINLWHAGDLFKKKTLTGAMRFLFGRQGMAWIMGYTICSYFKPGWKPENKSEKYSIDWLEKNADEFEVLR